MALAAAAAGRQLNFDVTVPGTLERMVGPDTDATSLTLSGNVDVRDLDFIGDKMKSLQTLDLSAVKIAAYSGDRKLTRQQNFAEGELPAMSLADLRAGTVVLPSALKVIGDGALAGSAIGAVTIPASVRRIGAGAFAVCGNLRSVTVPEGVDKLGPAVFRGCTSLETVTYSARVIPDYAFAGCEALKSVKLSERLTSVGNYAFADCTALSDADFSGRPVNFIGSHAFRNTSLVELDFSQAVGWSPVGEWAFADCSALRVLQLPANVTTLGRAAFFNDSALETLSAPNGITAVPDAAFKGASKFNNGRILGDLVVRIGRYALYGAESLSQIHFPSTLSAIDDHAFDRCVSLTAMNAPEIQVVPELGEDVWGDLVKSEITLGVPAEMIPLFKAAPVWQEFDIREAGIDDVIADGGDENVGFDFGVRFEGNMLLLDATAAMSRVELFDTLGMRLAAIDCNDASIGVDTSRWNTRIFIVRVTAGQDVASRKVARH